MPWMAQFLKVNVTELAYLLYCSQRKTLSWGQLHLQLWRRAKIIFKIHLFHLRKQTIVPRCTQTFPYTSLVPWADIRSQSWALICKKIVTILSTILERHLPEIVCMLVCIKVPSTILWTYMKYPFIICVQYSINYGTLSQVLSSATYWWSISQLSTSKLRKTKRFRVSRILPNRRSRCTRSCPRCWLRWWTDSGWRPSCWRSRNPS